MWDSMNSVKIHELYKLDKAAPGLIVLHFEILK